jgi:hypothetical protein
VHLCADLNMPTEGGPTPTWIACREDHLALASFGARRERPGTGGDESDVRRVVDGALGLVVRALAPLGADVNIPVDTRVTPVNMPMDEGATPVFMAAQEGSLGGGSDTRGAWCRREHARERRQDAGLHGVC